MPRMAEKIIQANARWCQRGAWGATTPERGGAGDFFTVIGTDIRILENEKVDLATPKTSGSNETET